MYNGIDISDLGRHFVPSEWFKLSPELQAESRELKAQKKRTISQISMSNQSEVSQLTTNNNAGNSFGSGSYTESANPGRRSNASKPQQE
jgi:hypothetical protein